MCTLWMIKKLSKLQGKVMCKCSYLNEEELKNRRNRTVLPSSASASASSRVTTSTNRVSSPSSSTSQREICTTLFSSPRSPSTRDNTPRFFSSPRQSETLEAKAAAWIAKDEAMSGGNNTPRLFLPKLKPGKLKRRVTIGSTLSSSSGSGDAEDADWPPFADEDYIVFCFEEDGAFHVVEESPKTISPKLQCEEHGNLVCACNDKNKDINHLSLMNRRDCLLPNKEAEEAMSPKLQQGGKNGDLLLANNSYMDVKGSTESMECRNGSVESTDSSQLDDEDQFQNILNPEVEYLSSPWNLISQDGNNALLAFRRDCLLPNTEVDEENIFLSPKAKLGVMIRIDDLLKSDNDVSSIESDQSSGFSGSDTRGDQDDQLEGNEKMASESAKSSISKQSNSSSTSFEFPVLEWAWMGSPVTWPRSGRVHFRKHRSRPACLKCCKF